jgi:hypothetical protein
MRPTIVCILHLYIYQHDMGRWHGLVRKTPT